MCAEIIIVSKLVVSLFSYKEKKKQHLCEKKQKPSLKPKKTSLWQRQLRRKRNKWSK